MAVKDLNDIKHGKKVIEALNGGHTFFVKDIQKETGLDERTLKNVLSSLLKHHYIYSKNGQWLVTE